MGEEIHELMELAAMQSLDMTANYFSTCESENRERVQETGKESEEKYLTVKWHFPCSSPGCR